jgi:hypothetical protein
MTVRGRCLLALALALTACGASRSGGSARSVIGPDAGLAPDAVHAVVRAHVDAIRACYERSAKSEGRPMGVVRLGWQIEPSGAVTSVQLVASSLHSAAVESCIADDVARWQFPSAPRATEIRAYPFEF